MADVLKVSLAKQLDIIEKVRAAKTKTPDIPTEALQLYAVLLMIVDGDGKTTQDVLEAAVGVSENRVLAAELVGMALEYA